MFIKYFRKYFLQNESLTNNSDKHFRKSIKQSNRNSYQKFNWLKSRFNRLFIAAKYQTVWEFERKRDLHTEIILVHSTWATSSPQSNHWVFHYVTDLAGDLNVEGFATSNSIFHLLNRDKCKNAPSTPQELQANLRNTPNGASSSRFHSDAQVSLAKPPKN